MRRSASQSFLGLTFCVAILTAAGPARANLIEGFDNISTLAGSGWSFQNNSMPIGTIGYFQGNSSVFSAQSGAPTAYLGVNFNSGGGNSYLSDWAITPLQAYTNGSTFSFWTRTVSSPAFADNLEVRLSTNGNSADVGNSATSTGDFTTLLLAVNPTYVATAYPNNWTQYTLTLSGLTGATNGRIAFRYTAPNAGPSGANSDYIGIDTLAINIAPSVVPEPSTLLLSSIAAPLAGWIARRRRRRSIA